MQAESKGPNDLLTNEPAERPSPATALGGNDAGLVQEPGRGRTRQIGMHSVSAAVSCHSEDFGLDRFHQSSSEQSWSLPRSRRPRRPIR
jgi:hypothetical protein